MKPYIFISILFLTSTAVYADNISKNDEPIKAALTLKEYKTIVKGWQLNEHCKIITGNDSQSIKSRIYRLDKHLKTVHDPEVIEDIKENAKFIIQDPKYSDCGSPSKRLIRKTPHRALKGIRRIHDMKYGLNTEEKKRLFSQYSTAKIGIDLDYQCDIFPEETGDQIHDTYDQITEAVLKIIPQAAKKLHEKPSVRATSCKPNSHDAQIDVTVEYIEKLKKYLNL